MRHLGQSVHRDRLGDSGCQGLRAGSGELAFSGDSVSVLEDEKSSGDGGRCWLRSNVRVFSGIKLHL